MVTRPIDAHGSVVLKSGVAMGVYPAPQYEENAAGEELDWFHVTPIIVADTGATSKKNTSNIGKNLRIIMTPHQRVFYHDIPTTNIFICLFIILPAILINTTNKYILYKNVTH